MGRRVTGVEARASQPEQRQQQQLLKRLNVMLAEMNGLHAAIGRFGVFNIWIASSPGKIFARYRTGVCMGSDAGCTMRAVCHEWLIAPLLYCRKPHDAKDFTGRYYDIMNSGTTLSARWCR